jgi:hypothetical protein
LNKIGEKVALANDAAAGALRGFLEDEVGIVTETIPAGDEGDERVAARKRYSRPNREVYLGRPMPNNALGASDDVELAAAITFCTARSMSRSRPRDEHWPLGRFPSETDRS